MTDQFRTAKPSGGRQAAAFVLAESSSGSKPIVLVASCLLQLTSNFVFRKPAFVQQRFSAAGTVFMTGTQTCRQQLSCDTAADKTLMIKSLPFCCNCLKSLAESIRRCTMIDQWITALTKTLNVLHKETFCLPAITNCDHIEHGLLSETTTATTTTGPPTSNDHF